jgi:RND superfamily putative drug exporter
MEIFGRHAWWLPSWLDRRLPRLAIEAPEEHRPVTRPEPTAEPVADPA